MTLTEISLITRPGRAKRWVGKLLPYRGRRRLEELRVPGRHPAPTRGPDEISCGRPGRDGGAEPISSPLALANQVPTASAFTCPGEP